MAKQPIYKPKAKPNGKLFPLLGITFFIDLANFELNCRKSNSPAGPLAVV